MFQLLAMAHWHILTYVLKKLLDLCASFLCAGAMQIFFVQCHRPNHEPNLLHPLQHSGIGLSELTMLAKNYNVEQLQLQLEKT